MCSEQFLFKVLDSYLKAGMFYSQNTYDGVALNFFLQQLLSIIQIVQVLESKY